MTTRIVKLAQPADPTIDQVFEEFLAEQRDRLKPKTVSRYEDVLNLLRHHWNGYVYQSLSKAESALFDRHYNANGDEHREFCELFGPVKINALVRESTCRSTVEGRPPLMGRSRSMASSCASTSLASR